MAGVSRDTVQKELVQFKAMSKDPQGESLGSVPSIQGTPACISDMPLSLSTGEVREQSWIPGPA